MSRNAFVFAAVCIFTVSAVVAVAQEGPRKTDCRQWDDSFLATFTSFTASGAVISAALGLTAGMLGRRFWWATSPPARIAVSTLATASTLAFMLEGWPRLMGFGTAWFSGVSPDYLQCQDQAFSATGLFGGVIGAGIPALAQWPAMLACLIASCSAGGVAAYLIGRVVVSVRGLARVAKAGAL